MYNVGGRRGEGGVGGKGGGSLSALMDSKVFEIFIHVCLSNPYLADLIFVNPTNYLTFIFFLIKLSANSNSEARVSFMQIFIK